MKNIKITELIIDKFRGITDRTIKFGNKETIIKGDNGTGKTTIKNAFTWLLFGIDDLGRKDFEIKPYNINGVVEDRPEVSVTAIFDINGKRVTLKRVYTEKWSKSRATGLEEFKGNTTSYFIDEEEVNKSSYDNFIQENFLDIDTFKVLSDVMEFFSLHWTKQRDILMKISNIPSNEDILKEYRDKESIEEILGDKDIQSVFNIIKTKRKALDKERTEIASNIKFVEKDMPKGDDWDILDKELSDLNKKKQSLENSTLDVNNKIQKEKEGILSKKKDKENAIEENAKVFQNEISTIGKDIKAINDESYKLSREKESKLLDVSKLIEEIKLLKKEYEFNESKFNNSSLKCPNCKTEINTYKDKAEFEKENNDIKAKIDSKEKEIQKIESDIEIILDNDIDSKNKAINELEEKLEKAKSDLNVFIENGNNDISEWYKGAINELEFKYKDDIAKAENIRESEEYKKILEEISYISEKLKVRDVIAEKQKQLESLSLRLQTVNNEDMSLFKKYTTLDVFFKHKIKVIEGVINSMFNGISFSLFQVAQNESVTETLTTFIGNVPSTVKNKSGLINGGLTIINKLSEYFNVRVPVFIDNRECITRIIDSPLQTIGLFVSKCDLTVDVED